MTSGDQIGWMGWLSLASAGLAGVILVVHLVRRPRFEQHGVKLALLMGLGVFPILSAGTANVSGFTAMQSRNFCGSCHVMEPHALDSDNRASASLAAMHARNANFGHDNCYACHKDYGMYGFVMTKLGGMGHVYYYLTEYHDMPLETSKHAIRIKRAVPNENCMNCHTSTTPRWLSVSDHASSLAGLRSGTVSCASPGCHGYAHPVTKLGKELLADGGVGP